MNGNWELVIALVIIFAIAMYFICNQKIRIFHFSSTNNYRVKIGFIWWLYKDSYSGLYKGTTEFDLTYFGGTFKSKEDAMTAAASYKKQKVTTV